MTLDVSSISIGFAANFKSSKPETYFQSRRGTSVRRFPVTRQRIKKREGESKSGRERDIERERENRRNENVSDEMCCDLNINKTKQKT